MLLTLNASCLREMIQPSGGQSATLTLDALPRFTREVLGLHGLYVPTALLAGADRRRLEHLREQADKAGCAVLVLIDSNSSPLGEPGVDESAVERLKRVVEAAAAVGATAITVRVEAADTQPAMDRVILNLKKISKAGEARDINVLMAPGPGLTAQPEKITEIIKKVGGFRIGTYPDLHTATTQKEPPLYLRRLTPYASALCAATFELTEAGAEGAPKPKPRAAEPPPEPAPEPVKPKGKAGKKGAEAEAVAAEPEKGAKKGKKAATPEPPPPPPPPEEDDDEDLDEDVEMSPEELLAALAPPEPPSDLPPEPELIHSPYDLRPLLEAIVAVGYEGSMGIDYRGAGDPTLGVIRSRKAIQRILKELE